MRSIVLIFCLLYLSIPSVWATNSATGTDIVFLIDQSGSMMGKGATRVRNDPNGKRITAIKALAGHLLQSSVAGYTNRISVVEFGGRNATTYFRPQVTLLRKQIPALSPSQRPIEIREHIEALFLPVKATFRGDTDIAAALTIAQQELKYYIDNPPEIAAGAQGGSRGRIVVLISDGAPYAKGVNQEQMVKEIEAWAEKLHNSAEAVTFTVFGMNDGASHYWDDYWGEFWRRLATRDKMSPEGLAFFISKDRDAVKQIGEVMSDLIPPGAITGGGDSYTAPAYLKALNFTIDYFTPHLSASEIEIRDPTDSLVPLTETRESFGTIVLPHPLPGAYQLRNSKSQYRVVVLPIYEGAELASPMAAVWQNSEEIIRYRLEGRGAKGQFVPQSDLPPVRFELMLQGPSGTSQTVSMVYDQNSSEIVSSIPVLFDDTGVYNLLFSGKTIAADGSEAIVYKSGDSVQVDDSTPVQAHFVTPERQTAIMLNQGKADVPVEVRFRNARTGAEISIGDVLSQGTVLKIGVLPAEPSTDVYRLSNEPVELINEGDLLTTQINLDFGHIRWDLLGRTEKNQLVITAPPSPWRDGIHYVGVVESGDYWLGPVFDLQESWFSLWVWIASILVLFFLLLLAWFKFFVPWMILRSDRKYKRAPRLSYTVSRNPDYTREWTLKGIRNQKPASQVVLASGETWTIQEFKLKRIMKQGNKVSIKLTYRPRNEKRGKQKIVLEAIDDYGTPPRSRQRIIGLPEDQAADFVLIIGNTGRS